MAKVKKRSKKKPDLPDVRGWVVTWRRIAIFCDVSMDTAKFLYGQGMPVLRLPSGTPMIVPEHITAWILEFNKAEMGMKIDQCFFCKQQLTKGE